MQPTVGSSASTRRQIATEMIKYWPKNKRIWRVIGALFTVAVAASAIWLAADRLTPDRLLAQHWRTRLMRLPADQAIPYLHQISQLHEAGLEALVDVLAGDRPELAQTAGLLLHQQMDVWQSLPAAETSAHVAEMARLLARSSAHMSPTALAMATDLTRRILQWPIVGPHSDPIQVIFHCDQIAKHWAASRRITRDRADSTPVARAPADNENSQPDGLVHRATSASQTIKPPALPGGGLPFEAVELPPLPPSLVVTPRPPPPDEDEPRLAPVPMHELPREFTRPSEQHEPNTLPGVVPESRSYDQPPSNNRVNKTNGQQFAGASSRPGPADGKQPEELTDLELVRCLGGTDPQAEYEATIQLTRRGFDRVQLEMGRKINSPDPATRLQLVQVLDRLSVPSGRWLIWLSRDADPRVRAAAAARMATAQDPQLHRRLAEMQQSDPDVNLRAQLQKWAEKGTLWR